MDKQVVFVVMGSTGEYSDHQEWPVRAFLIQAEAEALITQLDEWLRVNAVHMDSDHSVDLTWQQRRDLDNPFDPNFHVDYTGTRYYFMEVPF